MKEQLLIVENDHIPGNELQLILEQAGYKVCVFASQRKLLVHHLLQQLVSKDFTQEQILALLPGIFQSLIPFDFMSYEFRYPGTQLTKNKSFVRIGIYEYQLIEKKELTKILGKGRSLQQQAVLSANTTANIYTHSNFSRLTEKEGLERLLHQRYDINACLQFSLSLGKINVQLALYHKQPDIYKDTHLSMLAEIKKDLTALFNKIQLADSSFAISTQKPFPPLQHSGEQHMEGMLGNSPALLQVIADIAPVADTPVSVLILGESGTGKELVARGIHQLSSRRNQAFVVVNCATLPAELIESELFGHEKGAFTGAIEKRTGKFELANGGTLFLDEIGEMPLPLQAKLLRVLQEREFAALGSNKVLKVDVRILAATNKHLEEEIAAGRFRLDLFFRLNVYPITLPPLRDRKEDIPLLARAFLERSAARSGRLPAPVLSPEVLRTMQTYHWPGNIRELENLIERLVIRCRKPVISKADLPELKLTTHATDQTLSNKEAAHIIAVLKECNGKVSGPGGAAAILGLPPSTLNSRIKKLGITKNLFFRNRVFT